MAAFAAQSSASVVNIIIIFFFQFISLSLFFRYRGDFVNTIEKLMERKDKFDYIFIELDGLADPGPVASTFWVWWDEIVSSLLPNLIPLSFSLKLDDELESDLYLDGIVAIVDAKHILLHLDEQKPNVWLLPTKENLPISF